MRSLAQDGNRLASRQGIAAVVHADTEDHTTSVVMTPCAAADTGVLSSRGTYWGVVTSPRFVVQLHDATTLYCQGRRQRRTSRVRYSRGASGERPKRPHLAGIAGS